ncbi:MAG: hypothetical protein H7234_02995 [Herminiimonas sp.]|nr:hypothetical protein [Herminiimonas sp.]
MPLERPEAPERPPTPGTPEPPLREMRVGAAGVAATRAGASLKSGASPLADGTALDADAALTLVGRFMVSLAAWLRGVLAGGTVGLTATMESAG